MGDLFESLFPLVIAIIWAVIAIKAKQAQKKRMDKSTPPAPQREEDDAWEAQQSGGSDLPPGVAVRRQEGAREPDAGASRLEHFFDTLSGGSSSGSRPVKSVDTRSSGQQREDRKSQMDADRENRLNDTSRTDRLRERIRDTASEAQKRLDRAREKTERAQETVQRPYAPKRAVTKQRLGTVTPAALRKAVVWSEILGAPVSMRRPGTHPHSVD